MPNVMAAQPNIGGALCKSSVILFLVRRHKVWLMVHALVPCSSAANIGECRTWMQVNFVASKIPFGARAPKYIYSVPAEEMAKHPPKFC